MNIEKEREAFEGWFSKEFRCDEWVYNPFGRMEFNNIEVYSCSTVNAVWSAWLAAKDYAVPDGYKLVPVEPTVEMIISGRSALCKESGTLFDAYKAMIGSVE